MHGQQNVKKKYVCILFNVPRSLAGKTFYWRDNLSHLILATGEEGSETINCNKLCRYVSFMEDNTKTKVRT